MSSMNPFQSQGNTSLVAVTSAPSAGIQPSTGSIQGLLATWYGSAVPVYIAISLSSAVQAALPTTSAPGSMPILANTQPSLTVPPNCWLSAMTSAGTGSLYLTPGYGF